jgi:hypothetical protein
LKDTFVSKTYVLNAALLFRVAVSLSTITESFSAASCCSAPTDTSKVNAQSSTTALANLSSDTSFKSYEIANEVVALFAVFSFFFLVNLPCNGATIDCNSTLSRPASSDPLTFAPSSPKMWTSNWSFLS